MTDTKPIRRIAIIGTGVIGASWSSLFLAKGLQVVATDIAPNAEAALRTFVETKVQPIINKYWADDAFPFELLPSFEELGIGGLGFEGYGCAGGSQKLFGFVAMELARTDASFCTFFGVHSGLAMGSIYLDGSEEQKQK
jgi:alkylation response protein AidB-like acyl-CoA dehydrogenase